MFILNINILTHLQRVVTFMVLLLLCSLMHCGVHYKHNEEMYVQIGNTF